MGRPILVLLVSAAAALVLIGAGRETLRTQPDRDGAGKHEPAAREPAPTASAPLPAPPDAAPESRGPARTEPELPSETTPSEPEVAAEPGAYAPPPIRVDGTPRVYPMTRNVWVRPGPSSQQAWIGFLWFGASVRLRAEPPQRGPGCRGFFYAVEPRGYVCVDDERATLDPEQPVLRGVTAYAPNLASAWPHRYAESLGLRRHAALPSERVQRSTEPDYASHLALVQRARSGEPIAALLGVDVNTPATDAVVLPVLPRTLQTDRDVLGPRSTLAWTRERTVSGRTFLLSSDLKWAPKDRVKPYPTVTFQGVHLGRDARLPLAFFRGRDRPSFQLGADGSLRQGGPGFARLSWVELTGRSEQRGTDVYLETREPGLYVRRDDAVVPTLAAETPWHTPLRPGTRAGADAKAPLRGRQTWLEVSVLGGWLLAYEGHTPVFATLVSGGRGGVAEAGRDAVASASTPLGRFSITGKFATATMVAPSDLVHSEVPWAQNFSGPYALHGAYWHDRWGELASGGCINLSPRDARWLLDAFSEPRLPEGWHGVRWLPELEPATTLIVRR